MTSLDTNILIALWDTRSGMTAAVSRAFSQLRSAGPTVICRPVFSELLGFPHRTPSEIHRLLEADEISIQWELSELDWLAAGHAYQDHVVRRRASGGGLPRRMRTNILIGAHASVRGQTLFTLDRSTYSSAFHNLSLESIEPHSGA
jgi:predicted nucleic acid-binding protein